MRRMVEEAAAEGGGAPPVSDAPPPAAPPPAAASPSPGRSPSSADLGGAHEAPDHALRRPSPWRPGSSSSPAGWGGHPPPGPRHLPPRLRRRGPERGRGRRPGRPHGPHAAPADPRRPAGEGRRPSWRWRSSAPGSPSSPPSTATRSPSSSSGPSRSSGTTGSTAPQAPHRLRRGPRRAGRRHPPRDRVDGGGGLPLDPTDPGGRRLLPPLADPALLAPPAPRTGGTSSGAGLPSLTRSVSPAPLGRITFAWILAVVATGIALAARIPLGLPWNLLALMASVPLGLSAFAILGRADDRRAVLRPLPPGERLRPRADGRALGPCPRA